LKDCRLGRRAERHKPDASAIEQQRLLDQYAAEDARSNEPA